MAKHDEYKYLDSDYGVGLPQLVLACMKKDARFVDREDSREWLKVAHQTAGYLCNQHYLVATVISPRGKQVEAGIKELEKKWLDSCVGMYNVHLKNLVAYREDLHQLFGPEADCNKSFREFEEGIYPIDYTPEALRAITGDHFPEDINELLIPTGESGAAQNTSRIRQSPNWIIFVLGENCD